MKYSEEKIEYGAERDLLLGLITSRRMCYELCPKMSWQDLESPYARHLAKWIIEYFNKYKTNVGDNVVKLFREKTLSLQDNGERDNIFVFLNTIVENYDDAMKRDEQFFIDSGEKYISKRRLEKLKEDIEYSLKVDDLSRAEKLVTEYRRYNKASTDDGVVGFGVGDDDVHSFIGSLYQNDEIVFDIPGALGEVIGKIHKGDFISFLAPMKKGKTFALVEMANRAYYAGKNVLFISLEMTKNQIMRRTITSLTGMSENEKEISVPYFTKDKGGVKVAHKKQVFGGWSGIDEVGVKNLNGQLARKGDGASIIVSAFPSNNFTLSDLKDKLNNLKQERGFIPDVICIDYADLMRCDIKLEYRHQLDYIWKSLRGLAQELGVVIFTATQSNRKAFRGKDAEGDDVAEDIRKIAHVTSMVSINQTSDEMEEGLVRLKQIAIREGKSVNKDVVCTQCLDIARFALDSCYANELEDGVGDDSVVDEEAIMEEAGLKRPIVKIDGRRNMWDRKGKIRMDIKTMQADDSGEVSGKQLKEFFSGKGKINYNGVLLVGGRDYYGLYESYKCGEISKEKWVNKYKLIYQTYKMLKIKYDKMVC